MLTAFNLTKRQKTLVSVNTYHEFITNINLIVTHWAKRSFTKDICPSLYCCFTMINLSHLALTRFERTITRDKNLRYSLFSYILIAIILMNLSSIQSPIMGISASLIYVLINAVFLGHAFFGSQEPFFRLVLGGLAFVMLLGFVSWLVLALYNLNIMASLLVLLIAATVSSIMNRRMKCSNG